MKLELGSPVSLKYKLRRVTMGTRLLKELLDNLEPTVGSAVYDGLEDFSLDRLSYRLANCLLRMPRLDNRSL